MNDNKFTGSIRCVATSKGAGSGVSHKVWASGQIHQGFLLTAAAPGDQRSVYSSTGDGSIDAARNANHRLTLEVTTR